jgi:hypothetical protein
MRTLRMRIVTRRILRHRITIENSNILANFRIKLKSLESLFYGLIRLDLCKKNRRPKSHAWAPLSHTWGLHLFKQQSRRQRPCSSYANGDFTEASSATSLPLQNRCRRPHKPKTGSCWFPITTEEGRSPLWPHDLEAKRSHGAGRNPSTWFVHNL